MSQKLSKKFALLLQVIGGHGQLVRKHAIMVSRQEQGHVLTMLQATVMLQQLVKKFVSLETAVVIGDHGQIVRKHVVKESKQSQKSVTVVHSLHKKLALLPQLIGGHGQVALQHVVKVGLRRAIRRVHGGLYGNH